MKNLSNLNKIPLSTYRKLKDYSTKVQRIKNTQSTYSEELYYSTLDRKLIYKNIGL